MVAADVAVVAADAVVAVAAADVVAAATRSRHRSDVGQANLLAAWVSNPSQFKRGRKFFAPVSFTDFDAPGFQRIASPGATARFR